MIHNSQKIYFIGISGTAMGGLAIAFKKKGFEVRGSDRDCYPPMADRLKEESISVDLGYREKFIREFQPDLVIQNSFISNNNFQVKWAKEHRIEILSLTKAIAKFVVRDESVVIAGNYGKTTITKFLVDVLRNSKFSEQVSSYKLQEEMPSYLIGASTNNYNNVAITDSNISIVEGDEYVESKDSEKAKFLFYRPKYAVITDVTWDHQDIYPRPDLYINAFRKLTDLVRENKGFLLVNESVASQIDLSNVRHFTYLVQSNIKYQISELKIKNQKFKNIDYFIIPDEAGVDIYFAPFEKNIEEGKKLSFETHFENPIWNEDVGIALIMAGLLGVEISKLQDEKIKFSLPERRGSVIHRSKNFIIIDDYAHNAGKIKKMLASLRSQYSSWKITIVLDVACKDEKSIDGYLGIFQRNERIYIPDFEKNKFNKIFAKRLRKAGVDGELIKDMEELQAKIRILPLDRSSKHLVIFFSHKNYCSLLQE